MNDEETLSRVSYYVSWQSTMPGPSALCVLQTQSTSEEESRNTARSSGNSGNLNQRSKRSDQQQQQQQNDNDNNRSRSPNTLGWPSDTRIVCARLSATHRLEESGEEGSLDGMHE